MATAGYTNIGANDYQAGTLFGTNNPAGLLITMIETGSITKISAYVNATVNINIACKLYAGSAGALGALQATTNTSAVTTSFAWVDFTFASSFSASITTYWLEFVSIGGGGPGTPIGHIKYDTGGASNTGYNKLDNGTPSYDTSQYSIYATYTPTAVGGWVFAMV